MKIILCCSPIIMMKHQLFQSYLDTQILKNMQIMLLMKINMTVFKMFKTQLCSQLMSDHYLLPPLSISTTVIGYD